MSRKFKLKNLKYTQFENIIYVKRKSHVIHVFKKLCIMEKKSAIKDEILQELYKFVFEMLSKKLFNLDRFARFSWIH